MSYRYFFPCTLLLALFGCGYSFQTSKNPLLHKAGIHKIYVSPIINNTYKAGIENVVYNDLVRALSSQGSLTVVQNEKDADALLTGSVSTASYVMTGATSVSGLNPQGVAGSLANTGGANGTNIGSFPIATEYLATLFCSFSLTSRPKPVGEFKPTARKDTPQARKNGRRPMEKGKMEKSQLASKASQSSSEEGIEVKPYSWSSSFSRSKTFPGSNQLDVPGTTSALINDSEFERALNDLSHLMMMDVKDSMSSMF